MKIHDILYRTITHFFIEWRKYKFHMVRDGQRNKLLTNVRKTKHKKNALMLYTTEPFLSGFEDNYHQNKEQARQIASVFDELEFNVDVADWGYYGDFSKKYDLLFNIQPLDRLNYDKILFPHAVKIAYLTTSNPIYQNNENRKRLNDLYKRRGVRLKPIREIESLSQKIEKYDAFCFMGNKYNLKSYKDFILPPTYFMMNTGYDVSVDFSRKDSKKFLFLGSYGAVHKGLDLLLEVFADKCPDCQLYVCGKFSLESDFNKEYEDELYHRDNIIPVGFVDIFSNEFRDLCEQCSYMIMPSCSEGMAGSVLTAMSFGVIPLVSQVCGFDNDECQILESCSIESIETAVRDYSSRDLSWIISNSLRGKQIVESKYRMTNFRMTFFQAVEETLNKAISKR